MFLLELDNDGLVKNTPLHDSWKAIKEFRAVYDKYKIQGVTVVALTADYETPLKYYSSERDRFMRSQEEVYGNREKLKRNDIINAAIEKYYALQYNSDLERERQDNEYNDRLIERRSSAMRDETESGEKEIARINGLLKSHQQSMSDFSKNFNRSELISKVAITSNGYELSRIENDLLSKKNSKFANEGKGITNPNKLGLTDKN